MEFSLYNGIVKHLMEKDEGEDDDGSQVIRDGIFKMVDDTISRLMTLNLKVEDGGGGSSSNQTGLLTTERQNTEHEITPITETSTETNNNNGRVEIHKLQEFKITGGAVASRGEGELDYVSLSYQVKAGRDKGYKSREIMAAVVKAMKANSFLVSNKINLHGHTPRRGR